MKVKLFFGYFVLVRNFLEKFSSSRIGKFLLGVKFSIKVYCRFEDVVRITRIF